MGPHLFKIHLWLLEFKLEFLNGWVKCSAISFRQIEFLKYVAKNSVYIFPKDRLFFIKFVKSDLTSCSYS